MNAFVNAETVTSATERRIALNPDIYDIIGTPITTSYNLLPARLLGLSYADYCRLTRDKFNGTLHGRNGGYITITFKNSKDCDALVRLLNKRRRTGIASGPQPLGATQGPEKDCAPQWGPSPAVGGHRCVQETPGVRQVGQTS